MESPGPGSTAAHCSGSNAYSYQTARYRPLRRIIDCLGSYRLLRPVRSGIKPSADKADRRSIGNSTGGESAEPGLDRAGIDGGARTQRQSYCWTTEQVDRTERSEDPGGSAF